MNKPSEIHFRRVSNLTRQQPLHSIILLVCVLAALALFSSRIIEIPWRSALRGWDSSFYLMWVRSAVIDGDIHFQNELEINNTISANDRDSIDKIQPTETGYIPNKYGIGWGLMSLPFFVAADWLVLVLKSIGLDSLERDGYNFVYQVFLMLGHFFYAAAGLWCAYRFLKNFFDAQTARTAVAATWGCSMLIYYQTIRLGMPHNLVFALVAFIHMHSVALWRSGDARNPKRVASILIASGLLAVVRYPSSVFLIFPAACLIRHVYKFRLSGCKDLMLFLPVASIPPALQLLAWKVVYGEFLVNSYAEQGEGFNWSHPEVWNVLFSPRHGLFYWHPFLLIAFAGLIAWMLSRKDYVALWLIPIAAILYINACWWCWWFAASFGSRGFEGVVLFMMLGTAFILQKLRAHQRLECLFLCAALFFIFWNIYLVTIYSLSLISRQESVTWAEMLMACFR